MQNVAIALGSNLGDRRAHLDFALARLGDVLTDLRVSRIRETQPVDVPDEQPPYLNAVATGTTTLGAADLLERLLQIEAARGRTRPGVRSARTLDLDLVLYGDAIIDTPTLKVPHPRFRERAFVLEPLAEVAGDWIDPVTRQTIRALSSEFRIQNSEF